MRSDDVLTKLNKTVLVLPFLSDNNFNFYYLVYYNFYLFHDTFFCSRCYGNNRSSCSSCIDKWRLWQYPCYATAAVLGVG